MASSSASASEARCASAGRKPVAYSTASGSTADIANAYGALVYDNTIAGDPGICFNYFGGANSVTNGTFTVVWHANGIFRITV